MAQTGLRREHFSREQWGSIALGVLIGVISVYLAAIGKWPVATVDDARRLGLVFFFAVNAAAAGMFVGLFTEVRHTETWTGWSALRWVGLALTAVFIVAVAWADAEIGALPVGAPGPWRVAALLGLLTGGGASVPAIRRFRRNREVSTELSPYERGGLALLAALGGLVGGMVVTVAAVAISAVVQHSGQSDFDGTIPVVAGIDGEYVALGDSYSAGEGLRPFNHNTRGIVADGPESNRCHRSQRSYSQLLEFEGAEPAERFAACSGAVLYDIYRTVIRKNNEGFASEDVVDVDGEDVGKVVVPAQVRPGVVDEDVGLVTISIGGNDMLFSRIVRFCLEEARCMDQTFETELSGPRFIDYPEAQPLRGWLATTAERVGDRYGTVFPALARSFPEARILVLGYPFLFPDRSAGLIPDECTAVLRRVSRDERLEIRDLAQQFNDLLEQKATAAGLEYVSPREVWDRHEPCGADGQYTNAINLLVGEGSFHPNEAGQTALAHVLAVYLRDNP